MRFTFSWLKRFLDTNRSLDEIVEGLNSIGLEVEEVSNKSDALKGFKVAHIIDAIAHPSSDRLRLCKVDDGEQILQVICGASNARSGLKVVLASIGCIVPYNQMQIVPATIRGVESQGMLCSSSELLLKGDDGDGIIELEPEAPVGMSLIEYYALNDPVIEVSVTPNRGDCLGVYGIARDLSAKGLGILKEITLPNIQGTFKPSLQVDTQYGCSLFLGMQVRDLENKPSPIWLQNLLRNSGIRPISAVVDVTNYICHSFAQPMHAFDATRLDSIVVRKANKGEVFNALNDKTYLLDEGDIVIADTKGVHCMAGIIGGRESSCTLLTKEVYLEAAFFQKSSIISSSRKHNIITDSKMRFERHVDDQMRIIAIQIAAMMIVEICGGDFSEMVIIGSPSAVKYIEFDNSLVQKRIGLEIATNDINKILTDLGFKIEAKSAGISVLQVPKWRDLNFPEEIISEIIRIYGYDRIPDISLPDKISINAIPNNYKLSSKLRRAFTSFGYNESVTWSFMSDKRAQYFAEILDDLKIVNPISSELNYLRGSIIPNLLGGILDNQNRSIKDVKLFEIGPIFRGTRPEDEILSLAAVAVGHNELLNPHSSRRMIDIFDIKTDLETVFHDLEINF